MQLIQKIGVQAQYEELFECRKWAAKIPFIPMKDGWEIAIIPPFAGATARFMIRLKDQEKTLSVYLDCYDNLGFVEEPYWELYPNFKGDAERFLMDEIDDLVESIDKCLNEK